MPVSMMPEAARERTVSFRARAPHSLRIREYPRPKASLDERDLPRIAEMGTDAEMRLRLRRQDLDEAALGSSHSGWVE